jgi:hypothetical protein
MHAKWTSYGKLSAEIYKGGRETVSLVQWDALEDKLSFDISPASRVACASNSWFAGESAEGKGE